MARLTITLTIANAQNVGNDSQIGFATDEPTIAPNLAEQLAAAAIGYLSLCSAIAQSTAIAAASYRIEGSPGSLPIDEGEIIDSSTTFNGQQTWFPIWGGFGSEIGSVGTALAPIGTSVCVAENTGVAGRTGNGRHFVPFVRDGAVLPSGRLAPAVATEIQNAVDLCLLNKSAGGLTPITWGRIAVVERRRNGAPVDPPIYRPVLTATPRFTFSSLRSRRR